MEREPQIKTLQIVCVNFLPDGGIERFVFSPEEERSATPEFAQNVGKYLYEPNASLMKAGAFKMIAAEYPVRKLHINSHLYTSDTLVDDFPGRVFQVEEVMPFSSALSKRIAKELPQANITVRNFPLTVEALRKKTKIKEGGDTYIFATTLADDAKVLIKASKVKKAP